MKRDHKFWDLDKKLDELLTNSDKPGRPPKDGETATGQIQLRVTMTRKNAYVKAAKPLSLAAWMFQQCDKAAGYEPTQHD